MKSNFRYIIIFIIGSLSIVLLVQLFWLKGLYQSIEGETERSIIECLNDANVYELAYRVDSIGNSPEADRHRGEISVSQSIEKKEESNRHLIKSKKVIKGGEIITDVQEPQEDKFSLMQMKNLTIMIKEAVHQTLDPIAPINLDTVYSSLAKSFDFKKIRSQIYRIDIVELEKDSVLKSSSFEKQNATAKIFNYTYDTENNLGYRFYIESLTKTILIQMSGILVTTFLIILILGFAFSYLIRTIFQQKTLEEMKDDFTNNMTHELKTPIAVAYSATDALLNFEQGENKATRDRYLSVCKEQLEKLTHLVEQILSMSVERHLKLILKKESILIKELLEVLTAQHRIKVGKEIIFNLDIQPESLTIYADKIHLNNILSNLIDNSIKYSEGSISVDIKVYIENGHSIIRIKDNGIGIGSDSQRFLFDKFYRVPQGNKHNAKGNGIGLFYVKTIVEKHGGTISVRSLVNKGSEFTIKMPVE